MKDIKPEYPKLNTHKGRNPLSEKQVKLIQSLHKKGWSAWKISLKLKITYITARRWIDPKFRKKTNNYFSKKVGERYHNKPGIKERMNLQRKENLFTQRHESPKLAQYNRDNALYYLRNK